MSAIAVSLAPFLGELTRMDEAPTAIIVFAHGSAIPEANEGIARLAEEVSRKAGCPASCAFLELVQPDLATAVARATGAGAKRVIIIPCFLTVGVHVREDLPQLVQQQRALFPGMEIRVGQSLEGHAGIAEIILDRVREVLSNRSEPARAKDDL